MRFKNTLIAAILLFANCATFSVGQQVSIFEDVFLNDGLDPTSLHFFSRVDETEVRKFNDMLMIIPRPEANSGNNQASVVFSDHAPHSAFQVLENSIAIGPFFDLPTEGTFHIRAVDPSFGSGYREAKLVVENARSNTAVRTMMKLKNNGGAALRFENHQYDRIMELSNNFVRPLQYLPESAVVVQS